MGAAVEGGDRRGGARVRAEVGAHAGQGAGLHEMVYGMEKEPGTEMKDMPSVALPAL
ncbi:hypothetical protein GCM10010293_53480 [Streptomyces griseoflavus]|nr:hypothetical protein GCM10010293_53480 [Streptomyces griseoflavus]